VLGVVYFVVFIAWFIVYYAFLPRWSAASPDSQHPYALRYGHRLWYVAIGVGRFVKWSLYADFILLAVIALIVVVYRNRLERH
jgi:hypothetical protein